MSKKGISMKNSNSVMLVHKFTERLHKLKKNNLIRFFMLVLVLILYSSYVSYKFGAADGMVITLLTWTFFVFCTPVALAGFLIDFPIRLITNLKMLYTEIIVWGIAIIVNLIAFFYFPFLYHKTAILELFYGILSQPLPYWGIILLSCTGTFFSIYLGDKIMDVAICGCKTKKIERFRFVIFIFLIILIVILYDILIQNMGIQINW